MANKRNISSNFVTVPRKYGGKNSGEHSVELAYITQEEAKKLKKLDMHNSGIDKKMHYGPSGIPNYNGGGGGFSDDFDTGPEPGSYEDWVKNMDIFGKKYTPDLYNDDKGPSPYDILEDQKDKNLNLNLQTEPNGSTTTQSSSFSAPTGFPKGFGIDAGGKSVTAAAAPKVPLSYASLSPKKSFMGLDEMDKYKTKETEYEELAVGETMVDHAGKVITKELDKPRIETMYYSSAEEEAEGVRKELEADERAKLDGYDTAVEKELAMRCISAGGKWVDGACDMSVKSETKKADTDDLPKTEDACREAGGQWVDGACQIYEKADPYKYVDEDPKEAKQISETKRLDVKQKKGTPIAESVKSTMQGEVAGLGEKWRQLEDMDAQRLLNENMTRQAQEFAAKGMSFSSPMLAEQKDTLREYAKQRQMTQDQADALQMQLNVQALKNAEPIEQLAVSGKLGALEDKPFTPGDIPKNLFMDPKFGLKDAPGFSGLPEDWPGKETGEDVTDITDEEHTDSGGYTCTYGEIDSTVFKRCPDNPDFGSGAEGK